MKKVIYAILICIIIAGIVIIATMGLNADIIYSRNVELDVYIGQTINIKDMRNIAKEVFPGERVIVQEIELFQDMVSIKLADTRSEDELKSKLEELNNKINEKYGTENKADDITIIHNPKIKLSSIIMPYAVTIGISIIIILIYTSIRYRKLGIVNTIITYIISIVAVEMILLSIIAITRLPINRIVIPIGLLAFVIVVTILGFINERKLNATAEETEKRNNIT